MRYLSRPGWLSVLSGMIISLPLASCSDGGLGANQIVDAGDAGDSYDDDDSMDDGDPHDGSDEGGHDSNDGDAADAGQECGCPEDNLQQQRGDFIFHHGALPRDPTDDCEYFYWIRRFNIVLSTGRRHFDPCYLDQLRSRGTRSLIRFRFGWFHDGQQDLNSEHAELQAYYDLYHQIFHDHPDWLINPDAPIDDKFAKKPSYFFDFTVPELRVLVAEAIRDMIEQSQYDGVFLDLLGSYALTTEASQIWLNLHPDVPYNQAGGWFLEDLRSAMDDKIIFGNQAFRFADDYYPYIDYDMRESEATSGDGGGTAVIQVAGQSAPTEVTETRYKSWQEFKNLYFGVIHEFDEFSKAQAESRYPHVGFVDLNKVQPRYLKLDPADQEFVARMDRPAAYYGFVLSKLVGHLPSTSDAGIWDVVKNWDHGELRTGVFFVDLGEAINDSFQEENISNALGYVIRYFEKGFVIATAGAPQTLSFQIDMSNLPPLTTGLWNSFRGELVEDWSGTSPVMLRAAYYPATRSYYPSGRVYLYRYE